MSLHRTKATFIGLLEVGRVNEWVVTEKLGDSFKTKTSGTKHLRKFSQFSPKFWGRYNFFSDHLVVNEQISVCLSLCNVVI